MRLLKRLAATTALSLALALGAHAFGVGLQPTTVEIEIKPGQRMRQIVTIANVHKERPIALTLGLADWSLSETGQIELAAPGDLPQSASGWVSFSPAFIDLKPGESQQVVVDMVAPARLDSSGDHRFALLASTILPEERGGESGVWRKYQLASLFYLTVGDADSEPAITGAGLAPGSAGSPSRLTLSLANPGNAHARLGGQVEVRDGGTLIGTADIDNLVVLDGARRTVTLDLPETLPADAVIAVTLENTFAPQSQDGVSLLETWSLPVSEIERLAPAQDN